MTWGSLSCLFALCISALVKCLLWCLAHFSVGLFIFFLLDLSFLYIWDNRPLSNVYFANIFFHSEAHLLILLILSFTEKFLIVMRSSLSIISFTDLPWVLHVKRHHHTQGHLFSPELPSCRL